MRRPSTTEEHFLKTVVGMHHDVVTVDKGLTPLSMAKETLTTVDRKMVWQSKELHGRFSRALHEPDVDFLASVSWLRFGDLFGETEGFVCAIMDEVILTNNYRRYIMKDGTIDVCRACHHPGESIRHIMNDGTIDVCRACHHPGESIRHIMKDGTIDACRACHHLGESINIL